jgi:hypothetical protein
MRAVLIAQRNPRCQRQAGVSRWSTDRKFSAKTDEQRHQRRAMPIRRARRCKGLPARG